MRDPLTVFPSRNIDHQYCYTVEIRDVILPDGVVPNGKSEIVMLQLLPGRTANTITVALCNTKQVNDPKIMYTWKKLRCVYERLPKVSLYLCYTIACCTERKTTLVEDIFSLTNNIFGSASDISIPQSRKTILNLSAMFFYLHFCSHLYSRGTPSIKKRDTGKRSITILYRKKRWRLVHLPIVLSVRKP